MKWCFQVLLLIFIFIFSIFAYDSAEYQCKRGGKCGRPMFMFDYEYNYTMQEPKNSEFCYYYKCRVAEWKVMNGFGTQEDFINTCKYVDPMIKRQIASRNVSNKNFLYNDDHLILAICRPNDVEQCEKFLIDTETYLEIHKQFDDDNAHFLSVFNHKRDEECTYDNTPLRELPQVQCEAGGVCQSGKEFKLYLIHSYAKFINKTCDACVMFVCAIDGKKVIGGSGCYDDFVKACNYTNPNAVASFRGDGIKSNFYHDSSMMVASCSDADNCHKYAFDNYINFEILRNVSIDRNAEEECSYEMITPPPTVTTEIVPHLLASTSDVSFLPTATENVRVPEEPDHQKSSGITPIKLFVGIYFLLAVIY